MIGKRIQELRLKRGMTLTELATRASVSKSYLSNIERDLKGNPSIEVLSKISSVLGTQLYEFVLSEEEIIKDKEWFEFTKEIEISGISKESLEDIKDYIEFIKWRTEKKQPNSLEHNKVLP
ncbi:helix-turn-helix domain-containing protein [Bacillus timonensis]|nr:helix-turn-helix domain-containing protein [Bacillus timonensis]